MRDMKKIREPSKKARELGDEIVRLASWGMLSRLEIGAYLDALKFKIIIPLIVTIAMVPLVYQIPTGEELKNLFGLTLGIISVAISVLGILKGIETLYLKEKYERKVVIY